MDENVKKRETSISVADLRDDVKRMAISKSTANVIEADQSSTNMNNNKPITTVFSTAGADFDSKYEKLAEIGRGGFSVVYKCKECSSGEIFAVKVIYMYIYEFIL